MRIHARSYPKFGRSDGRGEASSHLEASRGKASIGSRQNPDERSEGTPPGAPARQEEVRRIIGEYINDQLEIIKKLRRRLLN